MRKAFRHTGVLMMMGVVALGLLGAAYTLWYEDLQITSDVSTGTFDADVSVHLWDGEVFAAAPSTSPALYEDAGKPVVIQCANLIPTSFTRAADYVLANLDDWNCVFGEFPEEKLDATTVCDAVIGSFGTVPDNANDEAEGNHLILQMSNLFPYAGCTYRIDIHNSGSVPMHVNLVGIGNYEVCDLGDAPGSASCVDLVIEDPAISTITENCDLGDLDESGQLQDGDGPLQLHNGDEALCDVTVLLDQGDDLENKTVYAGLTFRAYQWNESLIPAP